MKKEKKIMSVLSDKWIRKMSNEKGMISPFDVGSAISEVRRCVVELGFKAIFLRPNIVENRNWHDPYYDPLWAVVEDLGVPVGFHEGTYAAMNQIGKRFDTYVMFHTCSHPMELMLAVQSVNVSRPVPAVSG
mgnify:CR=1 FL=1